MKITNILFAISVVVSAYLLFQIQPIIGKYILPWFGGTSFVWITSLLFFQTILLCGYLYTYLLTRLQVKKQILLHTLLVSSTTLGIIFLFFIWSSPITPNITFKLSDRYDPLLQVLSILTVSVGLPYFLLSTTSTLLQKWFSWLPHNRSPYPLYALSNSGSLAAIMSYPFLIEPFLAIDDQGKLFSSGFLLLCSLLLICCVTVAKFAKQPTKSNRPLAIEFKNMRIGWLLLPACSSLVLLAGTHQLTQGIAPIPFLWLIPLGLYLISFILCFSEKPLYNRNFYAYIFLFSLPIIITFLMIPPYFGVLIELILYIIFLFSCFMLCHGELFAIRPVPKDLNAYYLVISFGSVIGAAIVALVAPVYFIGLFWEFLLGLFVTSLVAIRALIIYKNSRFYRIFTFAFFSNRGMLLFFSIVCTVFFAIISLYTYYNQIQEARGIWRNFYGILKLTELRIPSGKIKCLSNGEIIHGCQLQAKKKELTPTTYFGEKSIGLAFQSLRQQSQSPLSVGVIGLGVGTIAAYGDKGDTITFYELNPLDITIAKTKFNFMSDSRAHVATKIGDGRLSLESEIKKGDRNKYDLIVIDAFNDDAIPVHLLTKEAFADYRVLLKKQSILAVHISNSYLDLSPVIRKAAQYYGMKITIIDVPGNNDTTFTSRWAFLSDDPKLLQTKELLASHHVPPSKKNIKLWTDRYSNLFQIFKYTP